MKGAAESWNAREAVEHILDPGNAYDRVVIENCHPPEYINPEPVERYNLVAIGAGAAGLVSSGGAGGLGARAALIERTLTGGDCLNTGCVPSKGLIRAARAVYEMRNSAGFGIDLAAGPAVDFARAMDRMRALRARISEVDSVAGFGSKYNVDVYLGSARFAGPDRIEVAGRVLEFDRAVIATGARARELPIPGLAEAGCLTNENIFRLRDLPGRLAVIGGGPIGCELAQAFARFGSRVTVLNRDSHLLPREDADAAAIVQARFAIEGIEVLNECSILRVERHAGGKALIVRRNGIESEIVCDEILSAAGRVPNIEGLDLEAAGVEFSAEGVIVDDFLRTTNPRIYAAGDICSKFKFTHAADEMARTVLRNALFPGRARASRLVIPWCTYTDPEIAHVGLNQSEALRAGHSVATITESFTHLDRAILDGDDEGFARLHYDRRSGRILGGTVVSRHAGNLVGELTLAVTARLRMSDLAATVHPYPTHGEIFRKVADSWNRQRLTPGMRSLFGKWFEWRRRR